MSYEHAIDLIVRLRGEMKNPTEVAQLVAKEALEKGTLDNVTCVIVYLQPPKAVMKKASEMDVYEFLRVENASKREAHEKAEKEKFDHIQQLFDLPFEEKILEGKILVFGLECAQSYRGFQFGIYFMLIFFYLQKKKCPLVWKRRVHTKELFMSQLIMSASMESKRKMWYVERREKQEKKIKNKKVKGSVSHSSKSSPK